MQGSRQKKFISNEEVPSPNKSIYLFHFSEQIWLFCTIIVIIFLSIACHLFYQFCKNPLTQNIPYEKLDGSWIILASASIFWIWRDLMYYYFKEKVAPLIYDDGYPTYELKLKRSKMIIKFLCDIIWYSITSITGYLILRKSDFLPPSLLGNGDINNMYNGYPNVPQIKYAQQFYQIQLGNYVYHLIHQALGYGNNQKYWEWILHHSLATFLILFSYFTNFTQVGLLVMLCHDAADAVICVSRTYAEYKYKNKTCSYFFFINLFIWWPYFRVYVFPCQIVFSLIIYAFKTSNSQDIPFELKQALPIGYFLVFMLSILVVMHMYWTFFIYKGIYQYAFKTKNWEVNDYTPSQNKDDATQTKKIYNEDQKLLQRNLQNDSQMESQ